jgi:hypothetical protein
MRGSDVMQEGLFTAAKLEDYVPADHPLRPIRLLINEVLALLNGPFPRTRTQAAPLRRSTGTKTALPP